MTGEPVVNQTTPLDSTPDPSLPDDLKPVRNFLSRKIVVSILGVTFLLVGVVAGISLVQIRQRLIGQATIPNICGNQDVMLVIDRSSTMNATETDGRKKIEWAKDAALTFVRAVASAQKVGLFNIGIASFGAQGNDGTGVLATDRNSVLHSPLIHDYNALQSSISGVHYIQSGTCIECGLRIANSELAKNKLSAPQVVILLSDGIANHNWKGESSSSKSLIAAVDAANAGRAQGITYYAIGYGKSGQINENELRAIAGDGSRYQYKPNVQDWTGAFVNIANLLCPPPSTAPAQSASATPTATPTEVPTEIAVASPTTEATLGPTDTPLATPTEAPIETPIMTPIETPTLAPVPPQSAEVITGLCSNIAAYSKDWIALSSEELNKLKVGDLIHLVVFGVSTDSGFDKAQFNVNGVDSPETVAKQPEINGFYIDYVIPSGTKDFKIDAKIHHARLGWL